MQTRAGVRLGILGGVAGLLAGAWMSVHGAIVGLQAGANTPAQTGLFVAGVACLVGVSAAFLAIQYRRLTATSEQQ